jgi:hypothetical protein
MGQILSILWEILSILWEICYLIGIFRNHSSPPPEKVGQISFRPIIFSFPYAHELNGLCSILNWTKLFQATVQVLETLACCSIPDVLSPYM